MPGSSTTPGRRDARVSAPRRFAFRILDIVGARDNGSFAAQWLACTLPYRRFAFPLAGDWARLGADMDRYSFIAVDSHHLHFAGLPAHPENPSPQSVPANDGRRSDDDHRIAPSEESGEQCEADASHVIHASRFDSTLDIPRELSAKNQILGADRAGRAQEQDDQPQDV